MEHPWSHTPPQPLQHPHVQAAAPHPTLPGVSTQDNQRQSSRWVPSESIYGTCNESKCETFSPLLQFKVMWPELLRYWAATASHWKSWGTFSPTSIRGRWKPGWVSECKYQEPEPTKYWVKFKLCLFCCCCFFFLLLKAPHSILLVGALNNMAVNVQPDVFFSFSGQPGAVSWNTTTV